VALLAQEPGAHPGGGLQAVDGTAGEHDGLVDLVAAAEADGAAAGVDGGAGRAVEADHGAAGGALGVLGGADGDAGDVEGHVSAARAGRRDRADVVVARGPLRVPGGGDGAHVVPARRVAVRGVGRGPLVHSASTSRREYSCRGRSWKTAASAVSTIVPSRMTATRSAM